jgi:hypothetical protein
MDAAPHRSNRDVERAGDVLVAEARPGEQQERVAIRRRDRPQRRGQPRPELLGLDPAERVLRGLLGAAVRRPKLGPAAALGAAEVLPQQVDGDADEPRPSVGPSAVVAAAAVEGHAEGLGGDVLAGRSGAAHAEGVHPGPVPVEDRREGRRIAQCAVDHPGVVLLEAAPRARRAAGAQAGLLDAGDRRHVDSYLPNGAVEFAERPPTGHPRRPACGCGRAGRPGT